MKFKPFSGKLWAQIKEKTQQIKNETSSPIAAFDVDGTLWNGDISEQFFNYQIEKKLLQGLPENPWRHYVGMMGHSEQEGLMWLAQVNKGLELEVVRGWSQDCFKLKKPSMEFFNDQLELVRFLNAGGFTVYLVSGSIVWAVEPLAADLGLPFSNVLAMKTAVNDNIISDVPVEPYTWLEGKVTALLQATGGVHPHMAIGNSMGDFPFLQAASHFQLAVSTPLPTNGVLLSEQKLQAEAKKRGWATHEFV